MHVTVVERAPTAIRQFESEELAGKLTGDDVEVIREIFNTPLVGSYNWDYEAANAKNMKITPRITRITAIAKPTGFETCALRRSAPCLAM